MKDIGNNNGVQKVDDYMKQLYSSIAYDSNEIKKLRNNIKECFGTKELEKFDKMLKNVGDTTKNTKINAPIKNNNFSSNLKTALGIGTIALGIRKTVGFFKDATNESVKYSETLNLFNVSMGKGLEGLNQYYEKAIAFQEKLQEKLGINIEESMNYQALFNSMAKSMNINAKYAYIMSENFTKLGYDIASLYNLKPEEAMRKLRAGLAGETEPLRAIGLDVTEQTIKQELDKLGIDRNVRNMSQAEKSILRYISVLRQAQIAQGDFANTMDSPANQLRIFNAQITAFKRNMGNLWQGLLGGVLPYINGIVMVINELLKMVAKLFGFKISEQNVNISASVGADDLANDLGTATGKAKELKKQLMGFDEINNITLPEKTSGSSGGGASVGGIDQRLLDAMKEYDNMMDKVKNKATDIRDKIMEWLGFTKKINPLTGEVSWELGNGNTNLKKILNVAKLLAGLYIGTKVLKLIGYLRTLKGVITGNVVPMTSFQNGLALIGSGFRGTINWTKDGIKSFKDYYKETGKVTTAIGKTSQSMFNAIPNSIKLAGGIAGLTGSSILAYKSMEDLSNGTIGTNEAMLKLGGSIAGATASGALIGSVFGPAGTAIGALTGLTISGTSAFMGYKNETDKLCQSISEGRKKSEEYIQSIKDQKQAIQDNLNSQLAQIDYTQNLVNELDTLVDANGKVKDGYEDRVKFILSQLSEATGEEYECINGTIQKYGELKGKINEIIETKRAEITLNAYQEEYGNALKRQIENQHLKAQEQQKINEATKDYNDKLKKIEEKYGSLEKAKKKATFSNKALWDVNKLQGYQNKIDEATKNVNNYTQQIEEDNKIIILWEDLKTSTITENAEEIQRISQELSNIYKTESGNQVGTLQEQVSQQIDLANSWKKYYEETGQEINETTKKQLDARIRTVSDKLVEQTNTVETLGQDEIEAWKKLAEGSEQIYNEKISNVDEDTRLILAAVLGKVDISSPEYIEKWRKMANESEERYNRALAKLPEDTRGKISASINEIRAQSGNAYNTSYELGNSSSRGVDDGSGDWHKKGSENGIGYGKGIQSAIGFVTNAARDMVNKSLANIAQAQLSKSPSKKTRKLGIYNGEGFALGIKDMIPEAVKNAKDLALSAVGSLHDNLTTEGIRINPNDFKIDTNQFIDYGQISGAIATQSNVKVDSNIEGRIENAIYRGISNATIPVEIEATTDEGIIFKKVQVKAKEFVMQTGENPFPSLA